MKTLILDDEQPAIDILSGFVKRVPFLDLQLATVDAFKALNLINQGTVELLLLDVEMPDISGLELIQTLKKRPHIILTTAYEEFALQSYELDVTDYLVKPIRFERFMKGVNKAHHLHQLEHPSADNEQGFLFIKVEYKTVKIPFENILYIEGLKDYVRIFTKEKTFLTRLNVKNIEQKLPDTQFLRVHRSYIVSKARITSFQKSEVSIGSISIPIGGSYQEEVNKCLS